MKLWSSIACLGLLAAVATAQTAEVESSPTTKPITLVNLNVKGEVAEDVFNAVVKQAGLRMADNSGGGLWTRDTMLDPIDYAAENKPFWEVMRDLCIKYNVQPSAYNSYDGRRGGPRRISLQANSREISMADLPNTISEGCWIQATGFNRSQRIVFGNRQPGEDSAFINCMIYLDPAIRVTAARGGPRVTEALDENGNSLIRKDDRNTGGYYGGSSGESFVQQINVPLQYPAKNPGKKLTSLKFSIAYRVASEIKTITLDKLNDPSNVVQAGDLALSVKSFKKLPTGNRRSSPAAAPAGENPNPQEETREEYEMILQVKADTERNDLYNLLQTGVMVDDKGKAYPSNNMGGGSGSGGVATYTFRYTRMLNSPNQDPDAPTGPPTKWSIELPTKTRTMTIPVELKDLPLP